VPQGTVLSPTLFNIFTSDFSTLTVVQLALFAKTQAVFSTKRRNRVLSTFDLSLDGYSIPSSDRAKYLVLDKKLKFSSHFDYVSDMVQKLTRILYPLINKRSTHSLDQKVLLYKVIFQPDILYSYRCLFIMVYYIHFSNFSGEPKNRFSQKPF
jgi:hypothetical protein